MSPAHPEGPTLTKIRSEDWQGRPAYGSWEGARLLPQHTIGSVEVVWGARSANLPGVGCSVSSC